MRSMPSLRSLLAVVAAAALSTLGLAASAPVASGSPPTAPATASGWRELPPYDVPGGEAASCLRDAGGGRLALLGSFGFGHAETDLLAVGDAGATPTAVGRFSRLLHCAEVAARADGAPLLAATALDHRRPDGLIEVRRVVAEAGGAPVHLAGGPVDDLGPVRAAVAPSGAAVVAWPERLPGRGRSMRVVAATRPSQAAPFAPAQTLRAPVDEEVQTGIDAAGRAHVAWVADDRLHVWSADPGRRFAATLRSGRLLGAWEQPALAVAADGRALVVVARDGGAVAWELAPGGARFARLPMPHLRGERFAVALQPGGSAVVVGVERREPGIVYGDDPDAASGGVAIARRLGGGRFGGVQSLPVERRPLGSGLTFAGSGQEATRPTDWRPRSLGVALAPSGALVVAWTVDPAQGRPSAVFAAHGTLAHGVGAPRRLGSECRAVGAVVPFLLADGRAAVAWTDHGGGAVVDGTELGARAGRLHVAVADAEAAPATARTPTAAAADATRVASAVASATAPLASAAAAAPALDAEVLSTTIRPSGALVLRVRCDGGPCDVRARATVKPNTSVRWRGPGGVGLSASASLPAGAPATLGIRPPTGWSFAEPGRRAPVRLALTVCTPDGDAARTSTLTAPIRTRALPPAPRIAGLRARVAGRAVVVRWRLTRPLPRGAATLVEVRDHDGSALRQGRAFRAGGLRYRARVRLGRHVGSARTVAIAIGSDLVPQMAEARVAIRGSRAERPRPAPDPGLAPALPPDLDVPAPRPPGRSSPSR